jgi:hypothetical protein
VFDLVEKIAHNRKINRPQKTPQESSSSLHNPKNKSPGIIVSASASVGKNLSSFILHYVTSCISNSSSASNGINANDNTNKNTFRIIPANCVFRVKLDLVERGPSSMISLCGRMDTNGVFDTEATNLKGLGNNNSSTASGSGGGGGSGSGAGSGSRNASAKDDGGDSINALAAGFAHKANPEKSAAAHHFVGGATLSTGEAGIEDCEDDRYSYLSSRYQNMFKYNIVYTLQCQGYYTIDY